MNKRILLVEDNPSDIKLTERAFMQGNLTNDIKAVMDGEEALHYLHGQAEGIYIKDLPVIVLLDLKLPKIDGLEVLAAIRAHERTSLLPVVILTSSKEQEDIIQSYRGGANSYIRKPVDFKEFVTAIQQLGLYWLILNENPFHD